MNKYGAFKKDTEKLFLRTGLGMWDIALLDGILFELEKSHHLDISDNVYEFVEEQIHSLVGIGLEEYSKAHLKIIQRTLNRFPNG